jgi:sugar lactone lactonase YvrE
MIFPAAPRFVPLIAIVLGAVAPVAAQTNYLPYTFTTYAGSAGAIANTDGTGTAARFGGPYGLAIDGAGNLYVGDPAEETVRKITPAKVVTTIAGTAQTNGSANGLGTAATFNGVSGVAVDASGNVYAADVYNHVIRRIGPDGTVTTYAGTAGSQGSTDGTGAAARFFNPEDVAVDGAGNVYVSDTGNSTIRRIAPGGVVTTWAGTAGIVGSADGTGAAATFNGPRGLAVNSAGTVYVADSRNNTVRAITPARVVTTLVGAAGQSGSTDGVGSAARFGSFSGGPVGLGLDQAGNLYVADTGNNTLRFVTPGGTVTTLAGFPGYFGSSDGTGAYASFNIPIGVAVDGSGNVYVADDGNSTIRRGATTGAGYLSNLSVRAVSGSGAQVLGAGFVIGGAGTSGSKPVLLRGIGPTLASFGVTTGFLADPSLSLIAAVGSTVLQTNDNWSSPTGSNASAATLSATMVQVGAFALKTGSLDAAILATLPPAAYTEQVTGPATAPAGVALAEVWDATLASAITPTTPRLINVSGRAQISGGSAILIAGFVVGGSAPEALLIRGIGPGLAAYGVTGALANPVLTLYSSAGAIVANTGWSSSSIPQPPFPPIPLSSIFTQVGAFPLTARSADCAMAVILAPGNYTAQVTGLNGATGVGLVEVYEIR